MAIATFAMVDRNRAKHTAAQDVDAHRLENGVIRKRHHGGRAPLPVDQWEAALLQHVAGPP